MLQRIPWLLLALVHLLPALALFQPAMMTRMYRVSSTDPVFLLVQHRATLFLAVFVAAIWAAFDPGARRLACVVIAISMIGFVALWLDGGQPQALRTIALVDLAALPVLAWAAWTAFRA